MRKLFFCLLPFLAINLASAQEDHLIKSVYFGGGSYYIDEIQIQEIHEFIQSIPNVQHYMITVHSHTDNIGGAMYNEWLSEQRSNAAVRQLLEVNIEGDKIEIKDFGQFNPVYDNTTHDGRRRNRRVDIILWPITM